MLTMLKDAIVTPLTVVGRFPELFRSVRSDSLVEYTQVTRAEPIVLVDSSAVHLPYMGDVMQSLSAIFAGYYLQAIALSVNVGKIDTIKLLEKINPNRSPAENAGMLIGDIMVSEESYRDCLPNYGKLSRVISQEGIDCDDEEHYMTLGRTTTKDAQDIANLCVGRLLEVNLESDGNKACIPVSVRLIAHNTGRETLQHILSYSEKDNSVKERYHAWRSGQLTFIRDLILCQDLIDARRQTLIGDKSGVFKSIIDRSNGNKISALLSGQPSVATASNIVVMTKDTAAQLEAAVGGQLKSFAMRERMFKKSYVMLMVVIDTDFEQVVIYHRSIDTPTHLSVRELKVANSKNGIDVGEVLRAYQLGASPTI